MRKVDFIGVETLTDDELKHLYREMHSSARLACPDFRLPNEEERLSELVKCELNGRGYAILPGTCVPRIEKRENCSNEELKWEWK